MSKVLTNIKEYLKKIVLNADVHTSRCNVKIVSVSPQLDTTL